MSKLYSVTIWKSIELVPSVVSQFKPPMNIFLDTNIQVNLNPSCSAGKNQ